MFTNNSSGTNGDIYATFEKRIGPESIVFFIKDRSAEGLEKIYQKVKENISGKIAIKAHTGENNGPNIIPPPWV